MELTGGKGVNLLLDQFVGPNFASAFDMLAILGTVVVYNWTGGLPKTDIMEAMGKHVGKSPALRIFSSHCYDNDRAKWAEMMTKVVTLMAEGKVRTPVYETMPLAEARRAHVLLDAGNVFGKILLHP
jgi:NADPH:quinone reductase